MRSHTTLEMVRNDGHAAWPTNETGAGEAANLARRGQNAGTQPGEAHTKEVIFQLCWVVASVCRISVLSQIVRSSSIDFSLHILTYIA